MTGFDLKIMDQLFERDSTVPMLCEATGEPAEYVVRSLKQLSVYGRISRNQKVMFYGKAGDVWFRIGQRPKRSRRC